MFSDPIAVRKFDELNEKYKFESVVETGTNLAKSTLEFAKRVPYVFTIENNNEYVEQAAKNIEDAGYAKFWMGRETLYFEKQESSIMLCIGDSGEMIRMIHPMTPACYFLDAHWQAYWPIIDELKAIKDSGQAIIIHDFQVPGKDFGYDAYRGNTLNYDFVKPYLNPALKIEYNEEAEGAYRGIMYALP